jgi:prephenate dehydrogenase
MSMSGDFLQVPRSRILTPERFSWFPDPLHVSTSAVKEVTFVGRVAIFGPGVIGGSIAMALRSRYPDTMISAWARNEDELKELLRRGLADSVFSDPAAAVKGVDLVVLCTPVGSMEGLATGMAPGLAPTTLITDAGSVKACVVDQLTPILRGNYVGAHPMAGSERAGLEAARGDLFAGAPCLVTPTQESSPGAIAKVIAFWEDIGCSVTMISPVEHDRMVARLSHLPHALAYALMNLVIDTLPEGAQNLAGGSFRDATRVAASNPELWIGILTSNGPEVAAALREMSKLLKSMAAAIGDENPDSLLDFLRRAKHHRDSLSLPVPPEAEEAS